MIAVNDTTGIVYEARYGWTRRSILLIAVSAILGATSLLPDIALGGRILFGIIFWGPGLLLLLAFWRQRGTLALRVDARGISFGAPRPIEVPWRDLDAVVMFKASQLRFVGLQRKADAGVLPGEPGRATRAVNRAMIPGVPGSVVDTSLPINGWQLDRERMAAVIAAHAPDVQVTDLTR